MYWCNENLLNMHQCNRNLNNVILLFSAAPDLLVRTRVFQIKKRLWATSNSHMETREKIKGMAELNLLIIILQFTIINRSKYDNNL